MRYLSTKPCGRLLEIGCGAAALLHELSHLGYDCEGFDSSASAMELARRIATANPETAPRLLSRTPPRSATVDYLLALEVLEHIEDDAGAVRDWAQWLRPGGELILSVPAHMRRWGPADEWAGHVRRYEKKQIVQVLQAGGFAVHNIECYGFPAANLMDLMSRHTYFSSTLRRADGTPDREANNERSGIDRRAGTRAFAVMSTASGRLLLKFATIGQVLFLRSNLGTGFLVVARKK